MAKVTVVIPFWDLDLGILHECVDSVLAQKIRCDILVVDNCSRVVVAPNRNVRLLRLEERVSVGKARNLGLSQVTTPYVMFLDADDVLLPDAMKILLDLLAESPDVSLAAGGIVDWISEADIRRRKQWPSNFAYSINRFHHLFRVTNLIRNMTPVTGCAVMKTDIARKTDGFPDSTAEDWTFGVSMSFLGKTVLTRQDVKLYRWRKDGLSKIAVLDLKALYEARKVTRAITMKSFFVPHWIKALIPLLFVLHMLELPFHVRRERAFSDFGNPASSMHYASD